MQGCDTDASAPMQQEVANRSQRVIEVSIEDVASMDVELAQYMRMNTRRYTQVVLPST